MALTDILKIEINLLNLIIVIWRIYNMKWKSDILQEKWVKNEIT